MFVALLLLKSQMLFLAIFHQKSKYYFDSILLKPKYYSWQYFCKSPNITLAIFYKKTQYYFGNILQKPNTILATFYQKPKTISFWANNYSVKAEILFGQNIILCLKPKVKNLWQQNILTY